MHDKERISVSELKETIWTKDISNVLMIRWIQKRANIDPIGIDIYNLSTDDKANYNIITALQSCSANCLRFQLLIDHILELAKITNKREDSQKKETQLTDSNEVKLVYEPKNAIWWYTYDRGASGILN
jgi:hypothetical protein